ncbi:ubiquitin carboxyl-terminal hydrolase [Trifolium pratense]|uniref:Ubiquitin carboxyl-terminal hydrolase n=2 Tax=Trifolium pratense TaxID=57577 RepID=A0A2K3K090_TRIPR|nr:ubiquitin carboxyl-terminal hydrolase [Trifolium pratense]
MKTMQPLMKLKKYCSWLNKTKNQFCKMRYGHLSFKGLNTLVKKKMVEGLPQLNDEQNTCKHCLTGKQHREPIPKSANLESYQAA